MLLRFREDGPEVLLLTRAEREGDRWSGQIGLPGGREEEGDEDFPAEALEAAYDIRDSGLSLTRLHPMLRSLHSDPRWGVFLEKVGLA